MKVSKRWDLNSDDIKSWGKNAVIFTIPVWIIYFGFVQEAIRVDGFSWSDFVPSVLAQGAMVSWFLGEALALVKKWANGPKN